MSDQPIPEWRPTNPPPANQDVPNGGGNVVRVLFALGFLVASYMLLKHMGQLPLALDFSSPSSTSVNVECDEQSKVLCEACHISFSDWHWDGIFLKGKIKFLGLDTTNKAKTKLEFDALNNIKVGVKRCSVYAKDGTKLSDVHMVAPSTLKANETGEVYMTITEQNRVGKVVIHFLN